MGRPQSRSRRPATTRPQHAQGHGPQVLFERHELFAGVEDDASGEVLAGGVGEFAQAVEVALPRRQRLQDEERFEQREVASQRGMRNARCARHLGHVQQRAGPRRQQRQQAWHVVQAFDVGVGSNLAGAVKQNHLGAGECRVQRSKDISLIHGCILAIEWRKCRNAANAHRTWFSLRAAPSAPPILDHHLAQPVLDLLFAHRRGAAPQVLAQREQRRRVGLVVQHRNPQPLML